MSNESTFISEKQVLTIIGYVLIMVVGVAIILLNQSGILVADAHHDRKENTIEKRFSYYKDSRRNDDYRTEDVASSILVLAEQVRELRKDLADLKPELLRSREDKK